MGKVFPKATVRNEKLIGAPNKITMRKMFDAESKKLTLNIL